MCVRLLRIRPIVCFVFDLVFISTPSRQVKPTGPHGDVMTIARAQPTRYQLGIEESIKLF